METITGTPPRADPHDLLDRERRRAQAKERAAARKLERSGAPPPAAADPLEGYGGTGGASINAASPDSSWSERAVPPAGLRASLLSDGASSDASSFWGAPGSTSGNRGPVTRRDKLLQTLAPFIVPLLLLALASLAANLGLGVHVYSSYADAAVPCRSSPCQNGGSCSAKAGGAAGVLLHSCSCRAGFAGTDCDSPTTHACSKASCAEGGRCNVVAGVGGNSLTAACACDAGFYGAKCDKKCEAMVDVATAPGLKTLDPSKAPHQEKDWTLVFSDEFDTAGRGFAKGQDDKWTAADRATDTDAQNPELQYYSPKQVTTVGGQLIITATKQAAPGGRTWQSGMLTSRSKFCMSGGVLETSLTLPGSAATGGFWPAAWLLGQLAEAGVKKSSDGVWPFSYSSCPAEKDEQTPYAQKISACLLTRPRAGLDGLIGGQGRGAPELDIVEGWVRAPVRCCSRLQFADMMFCYVCRSTARKATFYTRCTSRRSSHRASTTVKACSWQRRALPVRRTLPTGRW